jgi:hypothetical protein
LDRKNEFEMINKKLTSEILNFKDIIKSREEEVKVLLGIIEKYKAMEENFKKTFNKNLDSNKRLVDRLDEEDKKLAEISNNIYGKVIDFSKENNNNHNINSKIKNGNLNENGEHSRSSSFYRGENSNSNLQSQSQATKANTNTNQTNNLIDSLAISKNGQFVNNFFNKNPINNNNNTNSNNNNSNNNDNNYNPIPISLLKEINSVNTLLVKPVDINKDIASNELKLYEVFRINYVHFSAKDEEKRRAYLKEKFEEGQHLAKEYMKLKENCNSLKNNVIK